MIGRNLVVLLTTVLAACSAPVPMPTEASSIDDFSGRFINVWGVQNIAEIPSARVRNGSQISTEVLVPRSPGQIVENGVDAVAISFRLRIDCRPVSYDLVHQTSYAADGRVLSSRPTAGEKFSPRGPYSDLADELCAGDELSHFDFTTLDEFRQQAATRTSGPIEAGSPSISQRGE